MLPFYRFGFEHVIPDPNKKGYDVFLRAIEGFGKDGIKVVMTPMPTRHVDLDYFYEVACKCKGNLTVFPIKDGEGVYRVTDRLHVRGQAFRL